MARQFVFNVFTGTFDIIDVSAGATVSTTEVDFGALPLGEKTFTVTDATVTSGSKIVAVISGVPTGKDADEVPMDSYEVFVAPGTGQFDVTIRGLEGYLADKFKLNYLVG